jgi:hypothetical protein
MKEHSVRSAALHRGHNLRHQMLQSYLGDNRLLFRKLVGEITDLEYRLNDLERTAETPDYQLLNTCREMLDARVELLKTLS